MKDCREYLEKEISKVRTGDTDHQKFIDTLNAIGCMSFSREGLGEELYNKMVEESKKVEVINYPPQIQEIVDTIKTYEETVRKTDLSNGIAEVAYHNGIYRAIEDILEIINFTVR